MSILISDPDHAWAEQVRKHFTQLNRLADVSTNGKECQLKIYKNKYECLILDIDTKENTGIEVLKFIRLNHSSIRVILTFSSAQRFDELHLDDEVLSKMGVSSVLIKPYSLEKIIHMIDEHNFHTSWKDIIENDELLEVRETNLSDQEFTRLDLNIMNSKNPVIFDCYVRLSKNRYLQIFNRGDLLNKERIDKYLGLASARYLYFKNKDRSVYINYMNDTLFRVAGNHDLSTSEKIVLAKSLTEKYIEEVHTKGLQSQLMEEGKKICENMYKVIHNSKDLSLLMRNYAETNTDQMTHVFLTSFFSVMIAKSMKWKSTRTIEALALGGLLHDIGKLKIDKSIREKNVTEMTTAEVVEYRKHPTLGAEMLQKFPGISEAVVQIIFQHHESMDGTGFPNRLSGSKIYPLAKVISLADAFAHEIITYQKTPIDTLCGMISNRAKILRFDPLIVKALITCFIKVEEK